MAVGTTDRAPVSAGADEARALPVLLGRLAALAGWRRMVLLGGVALLVRLGYLLLVHGEPLAGASATAIDLATRLATGNGLAGTYPQIDLHPTAVAAPAHPYLLGIVFELAGPSVALARLVNIVLGVGVVLAVDRLGLLVGGRALHGAERASLCGLVAALAVAVFPPLVANDVNPLAEPLVLLTLVAMLVLVLEERTVLGGLAGGLLVLARPGALLAVGLCIVWVGLRLEWRRAGWFLLVASLVVFPWLLRNSMVLGTPVLVTSGGVELAALYSDEAHAGGIGIDVAADPGFDDLGLTVFDEVAWDRAHRERALDDLRGDPRRVTTVVGRNLLAQLELLPGPNAEAEARDGRVDALRVLGLVLWPVLLVGGVWGLVRFRRSAAPQLVALVAVGFVVHNLLLVVASPRLRAPVDVVLCVGLGLLVADLSVRSCRGSDRRRRSPG